jgi:hypothetical protein
MLKVCQDSARDGFRIVIELTETDEPNKYFGNIVESNLHDHYDDEDKGQFVGAIHGLESFVLALACAGVDIESQAFGDALSTAIDACAENLP